MSISRIISVSLKELLKYKMRTFLMMLGIMIGIATLTVILVVGKGVQKKIMKGLLNFGHNTIMVMAGGGKMIGPPEEIATTLTMGDAKAIKETINGIRYIAPYIQKRGQNVIYDNKNTTVNVMGVPPEWKDAWQWYPEKGDFISGEDNSLLSKTCVLGQTVVRELFDNQNPIGETVRIKNINFKVIGTLKERGAGPMGTDMDNRILVPLSTAKRRLFNISYINTIRISVESLSMVEAVTKEVKNVLRERHHIMPPAEDDFMIKNATSISKMVKDVSGTLTTFLGLLSLISLAVGGIVIANIMFVSVNERGKEIGVRRAFGATVKDIMKQFLGEALIVTISGGIIGTIIGIIVSIGLSMFKEIPVVVSWQPFALAIVFSGIVGIAAGIKPARRAAALNPVDAIRG